jgi:ATP-dependent 26S proteasome regulatory subunit
MINNFIPQKQDGNLYQQPPQQHQNYQQQQMIMYQQQLQQQKLIEQQRLNQANNQMNNVKHPGLTVGTVIAQPNKNYNPISNK